MLKQLSTIDLFLGQKSKKCCKLYSLGKSFRVLNNMKVLNYNRDLANALLLYLPITMKGMILIEKV